MVKKNYIDKVKGVEVSIPFTNRDTTIDEMILQVLVDIHEELKELNTK